MKKTINGKTYDTNIAQAIGKWSNDHAEIATLYRTSSKGAYFLHRAGGAAGETIVPLSSADALEWIQGSGTEGWLPQG